MESKTLHEWHASADRSRPGPSQVTGRGMSGPTDYASEDGDKFLDKKIMGKKLSFWLFYVAPPLTIIGTVIMLVPVMKAIAEGALKSAKFDVQSSNITKAGNSSFDLALGAAVSGTGPFPASLEFKAPMEVFWLNPDINQQVRLGHFDMGKMSAAGGKATINQQTHFFIDDEVMFGKFAQHLITSPNVTWHLECPAVQVKAFNFLPVYKLLVLKKDIVLNAINNLPDIKLIDVSIPGNDPAGGIQISATALMKNPSAFGMEVGTLVMHLYLGDLFLGPVSANNVKLTGGQNILVLSGRMLPYPNDPKALEKIGELMSNFISSQPTTVTARGISATNNGQTVAWLQKGISSLRSDIAFMPPEPINPIKDIFIEDISLFFDKDKPWSPYVGSNHLKGNLLLPFGFSLNISRLSTKLSIEHKGSVVGSVTGAYADATTSIKMQGGGQTYGQIALALPTAPMELHNQTEAGKNALIGFEKALVMEKLVTFVALGEAKAVAMTPIGQLALNGIKFNVTTGLIGLNGLKTYPTIVNAVEVTGGTKQGLTLNIALSMVNPSNLNISAGDCEFHISKDGHVMGSAFMKDMKLVPGKNDQNSTAIFDPNRAPGIGADMLAAFITGKDSALDILGFPGSSKLPSLAPSLEGIKLTTGLPALHQPLILEAVLTVPKNISQTGIAYTAVRLNNTFGATISLDKLKAAASFEKIIIGTIDVDLLARNMSVIAPGKQVTLSSLVPINLNIEPKHLIEFLTVAAKKYNVNLGPMPEFFKKVSDMKDTKTNVVAYPDDQVPPCNGGKAFDTAGAVLALLKPMTATLPINSTLRIGDYSTSMAFTQENVPIKSDNSSLYLVGPVAAPLIQMIVNESTLEIGIANASKITDNGFEVSMRGSMGVKTPADAYIEFPDGLFVNYKGTDIAVLALKPLCATAPDGLPDMMSTGHLNITNQKAFEDFTYDLLTTKKFKWTLHTKSAVARSLGMRFSNVNLEKTIELEGMDGLPGMTIDGFTSNGDSDGAINISAVSPIKSTSSLGVELDAATFDMVFQGQHLGRISSKHLFIVAKTITNATFAGVLLNQRNNKAGLDALGLLFSTYLAGKTTTLSIHGVEVRTDANGGRPVQWMSNALKRFSANITLPGKVTDILFSIQMTDLTVVIKDRANSYSAIASNNETLATFANPFAFHLQPLQLSQSTIMISYNGVKTANLTLPTSPVIAAASSGPKDIQPLRFGFRDQRLVSLDNRAYSVFLHDMATSIATKITVNGKTDVLARTQIGDIAINGVSFELPTTMKGMNSFGGKSPVTDVVINDPQPAFLGITLFTELTNPSNVTMLTDNVNLPVFAELGMIPMGIAHLANLNLYPGVNKVPTIFRLYLSDPRVLDLLQLFVQCKDLKTAGMKNTIPLVIAGRMGANPPVTPYASLEPTMADLKLKGDLIGIGARIVLNVRVYIPMSLLTAPVTGTKAYGFGYIDAVNNLPVQMRFHKLTCDVTDTTDPAAGIYSQFVHSFDRDGANSFLLPAARPDGTPSVPFKTSPLVDKIELPKGLTGSLPLIPHNVNTDNKVEAHLIGPNGEFFLPGLRYIENNINTTYYLTRRSSGDEGGIKLNQVMGGLRGLLDLVNGNAIGKLVGGRNKNTTTSANTTPAQRRGLGAIPDDITYEMLERLAWENQIDDDGNLLVRDIERRNSKEGEKRNTGLALINPMSRDIMIPPSHRRRKVIF